MVQEGGIMITDGSSKQIPQGISSGKSKNLIPLIQVFYIRECLMEDFLNNLGYQRPTILGVVL